MTPAGPPGAVIYPAAERNKPHILECLKKYILPMNSGSQILLEIGAGTGQHTAHFAPHFPNVTFIPTEFEPRLIKSIDAFRHHLNLANISKAAILDVTQPAETWLKCSLAKDSVDYVYSANMIHISPLACTKGLFEGASYVLKPGGYLFMYGPFAVNGTITPESNVRFDKSLRQQDPDWGLRDITRQLVPLADVLGLTLFNSHDLPANNKFLVWLSSEKTHKGLATLDFATDLVARRCFLRTNRQARCQKCEANTCQTHVHSPSKRAVSYGKGASFLTTKL